MEERNDGRREDGGQEEGKTRGQEGGKDGREEDCLNHGFSQGSLSIK